MTSPGQSTLPTSVPQNVARTTVEGTGALVFKVATVVLVLLALLLAGAYAVQVFHPSKDLFVPGEPAEPPANAPIPGRSTRNLWEEETPKNERRPVDAQRALASGDELFVRGDFRRASGEYERAWRLACLAGIGLGALAMANALGGFVPVFGVNPVWLAVAGLLVGYGTRLGAGCTSGHGICGLARFSKRSLIATLIFMASAIATVFVVRHAVGG